MKRTDYQIIELFEITDRGTVVVVDEAVKLNGGKPISIQITRPDGSAFAGTAFVERLLQRASHPIEKSALLIPNVKKDSVPEGSILSIETT